MEKAYNDKFIEMIGTKVIVQLYSVRDSKPKLLTVDDFDLKTHEGMPFLTLDDIKKQVVQKYPETSLMIDVWYELGLSGHIYRYGNHGEYWVEHGTTRGYA